MVILPWKAPTQRSTCSTSSERATHVAVGQNPQRHVAVGHVLKEVAQGRVANELGRLEAWDFERGKLGEIL